MNREVLRLYGSFLQLTLLSVKDETVQTLHYREMRCESQNQSDGKQNTFCRLLHSR